MISFDVKGGKRAAFDVLRALEVVKISNNLGDAKSLVTHPATTTHQRLKEEERAEARHRRRSDPAFRRAGGSARSCRGPEPGARPGERGAAAEGGFGLSGGDPVT